MNTSRRFGLVGKKDKKDARARRLAAAAGGAAGKHEIEQLETRQMLFVASIGSVDPATGLGTVNGSFSYVIPRIGQIEAAMVQDTQVNENFDDEMAGWTQQIPPAPPSGTFFEQSNIQISYSAVATAPVQLVRRQVGQNQIDAALRIALSTTDQTTFTFFEPQQGQGPPTQRQAQRAIITISNGTDGGGLNTDPLTGTRVELLRNGEVVATFRGNTLANLGVAVFLQTGVATRFTFDFTDGFDSIRFSAAADPGTPDNDAYADNFVLEDISAVLPGGKFATDIVDRTYEYNWSFTGPQGASIQFLDLYGRDIININGQVPPDGSTLSPLDANDNGIPDRNDGIGKIIILGTNANSSFTATGSKWNPSSSTGDPNEFPMDLAGFLDDFQTAGDAGFGFRFDTDGNVVGLPPGPGSVFMGSTVVRNNSSPAAYFAAPAVPPAQDLFNRVDQGIFVNGGASMGSIYIHGLVFGSSHVTGALQRFVAGVMLGSLRVDGDLGLFSVASDSGVWVAEDQLGTIVPTGGRLTVGRTLREVAVGGRNAMVTSVQADINNPNRARLSFLDYFSRERVFGFDPATQNGVTITLQQNQTNAGQDFSGQFTGAGQAVPFGDSWFRNDSLSSAEYVGYNGTRTRIFGQINGQDPVNTAQDANDVYAFPADPSREIVISSVGSTQGAFGGFTNDLGLGLGYIRVVDKNGVTVAALDAGRAGRGPNGNNNASALLRFRPDKADTYYLVINAQPNGPGVGFTYGIAVTGMAPVTFGHFRAAAGAGYTQAPFTLTLSSGSMGMVNIGNGMINGDASTTSGAEVINTNQAVDVLGRWGSSTVNVPGNLYNLTTGWDVDGATLVVGGDLGTFNTGNANRSVLNGDLYNADIRVGRRIGEMEIRGGLAVNQLADNEDAENGVVSIISGTTGQNGDIGVIGVGAYANGRGISIRTSPGSQFDQFLIGTNNNGAGSEHPGEIRGNIPTITTGVGSDVRFVDFRAIQRPGDTDIVTIINYGQSFQFSDDAGALVTISISGGSVNPPGTPVGTPQPTAGSQLVIRTLAINGSRGVTIASIEATLNGGANLVINGDTAGVVSIGRILVNAVPAQGTSPGTPIPNSNIIMQGQAEIDVWRIDQVGGVLASIQNNTTNGDIVAIDALALKNVTIFGNLGRTQVSGAGPLLLGPFLGITGGASGVTGPLSVDPGSIGDWDGSIFLPVTFPAYETPNSLEDVGSPIDGYLNGVVVRSGDLVNVQVRGTVGDVLVPGGHLVALTANSDNITPQGGFQGIEGSIYAVAIGTVNIGDGLKGTGPGPFAQAGIFADTSIVSVIGNRPSNTLIQGSIIAASQAAITAIGTETPTNLPAPLQGIGSISLTNGKYDGALILAQELDDFWGSVRVRDIDGINGTVGTVTGNKADLFRSEIGGASLQSVSLTQGAYDASFINVTGSIGSITADEFRNSTRLGVSGEFFTSRIQATNDLANITTNGLAGDIADLTVDLGGSLTGAISAKNVIRTSVLVDNTVNQVSATNDVRSSTVIAGALRTLTAGQSIRSTSLAIAGPITTVTAGNEITQLDLQSTGPDGALTTLRAQNLLQADVTSSGPIGTIQSVTSDVQGNIETRNDPVRPRNGGLGTLSAGRDLLVSLSILGDTATILAGRNVGTFGAVNAPLDLRGNLGSITTTTGQIYSDLLVGQSITGTVTTGRVDMRPGLDQVSTAGILVFGSINALNLKGDFNGDIISRSGGITSITITDGSFRPDNSIIVNNGNLGTLTIRGGDLLGDVLVDGNIGTINVLVGADGFKGQIGIASWRRTSNRWKTDIRNELPPGAERTEGIDGATIKAGGSIGTVMVEQGSFTESQVIAGTTIGTVFVKLQLRNDSLTTGLNNAIVSAINTGTVQVGGFTGAVAVLGGVTDLGADGRVGGTGADADTVGKGAIGQVLFQGPKVVNSVVSAGIAPDSNGKYNTSGSEATPGTSSIGTVTGNIVVNTSAYADGSLGATSAGIVRGGTGLAQEDPSLIASATMTANEIQLTSGVAFAFTTLIGENGLATFTGPGKAFWDPTLNRIRLLNPNLSSALLVVGQGNGRLTNLLILSNTNTSLGTLTVQGTLRGNSKAFIDTAINTLNLGTVDAAAGTFGSGGDIQTISIGSFLAGVLRGRVVNSLGVTGDFGRVGAGATARAKFLTVNSVNVAGTLAGAIAADGSIPTVTAGTINGGGVTSGGTMNSVTAASTNNARITARSSIQSVNVAGNATGTSILGGVDLGDDADFGGTDGNADTVGSGAVGTVTVGGNFQKSDVTAGVSRGPSGFIGDDDAVVAAGRSSIGSVTIAGSQTGSNFNSEQYRVTSTGTIGPVMVAGMPFTGSGNFQVVKKDAVATPVRILSLKVSESSRLYTATITFNQPIDASTLGDALSVIELRNGGATTIGLAEGTDYTVVYDKFNNAAMITFNRSVTDRNLPQAAGVPGPGTYQFILSAAVLRGSTQDSELDGNGNGQPGDDWVANTIIGDAGDKIVAGNPSGEASVDFYGAADLDLVLRVNPTVGSVPQTNFAFPIRGNIGDHPDSNPDTFRVGGDVDVYKISLKAGQILRLGEVTGVGLNVQRGLYDAAGNQIATGGGNSSAAVALPSNSPENLGATGEQQILIKQTATYYLVVAGQLDGVSINDLDAINNIDPVAGAFGQYSFDITVIDDDNTGFAGDTSSGTGAQIAYPPTPSAFAGVDGQFNTADDLKVYTDGDWTFTLKPGTPNPGSANAVVSGSNSLGWTSTRTSAPNGTFGTINDKISVNIKSAIGLPGSTGTPVEVAPDIDVFSLNNGQPLAAGTKIRATLRLTGQGSNIGLAPETSGRDVRALISAGQDLLGYALFGLFEMPAGTGFDNAKLVLAPSDFAPIGGQAAVTKTDGKNAYGYDANGDFFMDIVLPGTLGIANSVPASYALVLQGAIRSDYTLEITQQGATTVTKAPQNVLLETLGGTIDWLEAGEEVTTKLSAFTTSVVGFQGQINGQNVDAYVLNNLVANLNALFTAANLNVVISTSAATFQRQDFSTVFLAGNVEPNAFFGNGQYGASQHVDMLNVDKNDQAVVYASSLGDLGFDPSQPGVDAFTQALTAAVGRRIGELLGVRFETNATPTAQSIEIMAANSPTLTGANLPFRFTDSNRFLAGVNDGVPNTAFFLGQQNSLQLLQKIVSPQA